MLPTHAITGTAQIKGIFRELAALRKPVYFLSEGTLGVGTISLCDDLSRKELHANSLRFHEVEPEHVQIELRFELDHIQYRCVVSRTGFGQREYSLPDTIEPIQRRKKVRSELQTLSRDPLIVEIRGHLTRAYGYLKDSDAEHITARVSTFGRALNPGDLVFLRSYTDKGQVYANWVRVKSVRPLPRQEGVEVLMRTRHPDSQKRVRRTNRADLGTPNHIELNWPDTEGLRLRLEITNATSTGFSGRVIGSQVELPPIGAYCRIAGSQITAHLQWHKDGHLGFDLSVNDRKFLAQWNLWLDEWQLKVLDRTPAARQQARIASVLLRSGYLRDVKASAFVSTPDLFSLIPNNQNTRSWLRRFLRGSETNIDAHVSFARCSDSSWIIQELGNSAIRARLGDQLLKESLEAFHHQESPYLTYGSTLLALFDPLSRFNQQFWLRREALHGLDTFEARLINIDKALQAATQDPIPVSQALSIIPAQIPNWPEMWNALAGWVPTRALLGLGLRTDDFTSPDLKQALAQSGYHLARDAVTIFDGCHSVGLAVVLGLPTFSNLNATSSHLWLVLRDVKLWQEALHALFSEETRHRFAGVTEAVVMVPGYREADVTADDFQEGFAKRRRVFFIPTHAIKEFLKDPGEE